MIDVNTSCSFTISVETECLQCSPMTIDRKRLATSIFSSFDMVIERTFLFFVSIMTHNHINSEPIFTIVSSTIYLSIFLLVENSSFFGKYFWIQFYIETWFLMIKQRVMALQKFFLITNLKNKNIKKITNIF